jgi:hypothetical protein
LGRACIARADARRLFEEKRREQKARGVAERNERQAIEQDRQWRAGLPKGAAWYDIPAGMSPALRCCRWSPGGQLDFWVKEHMPRLEWFGRVRR